MKKILLSAACVAALAGGTASAEEEAAGPWSIGGSITATSNYVFRGFSQTLEDPALQAGVTLSHESGFYAGFWGSNVNFGDGETDLEFDFIAGYGGALGESTSFDINVVYYTYPGAVSGSEFNFVEIGGGITHDFGALSVGVKVAYSPEFFGDVGDAFWGGLNVSVPLGDYVTISGNVGKQWYADVDDADYLHYDIGVTFAYENVSLDLRFIDTDVDPVADLVDEYFVATLGFSF